MRYFGENSDHTNENAPSEFVLKVAFFQKVRFIFYISESLKQIFQKTILSLKFKFQVQDSFLEYFFGGWRFEKCIALSEKKPPLKLQPSFYGWSRVPFVKV